VYQYLVLYQPL